MVEIPPEIIAFAKLDKRCAKVVNSKLFRSFSSSKRSEFVHLLALAGSFENLPAWIQQAVLESEAQTTASAYDANQPRDENGQWTDTGGTTGSPKSKDPVDDPDHTKKTCTQDQKILAEQTATLKKTPLKLTKEVSELIKEKIKVRMAREALPQNKTRKE